MLLKSLKEDRVLLSPASSQQLRESSYYHFKNSSCRGAFKQILYTSFPGSAVVCLLNAYYIQAEWSI